jgi:hypothetical protein
VQRCVRRHTSDHHTSIYTVYPIQLVGPRGALQVWEADDLDKARNQAEGIAKAIGFPLADRTGAEEIVREAGHLDESLRERRHCKGEGINELPPMPHGMKTQVRMEGRELALEIPPAGWPAHPVAGVVVALFLAGIGIGFGWIPFKEAPRDLVGFIFAVLFSGFAFLGFVLLPTLGGGALAAEIAFHKLHRARLARQAARDHDGAALLARGGNPR